MRFKPAKKINLNYSSGQAVLFVILSMAVVLTVVLSVSSRSVTDVSVTSIDENSSKAFSAAEAGIEKLLIGESNLSDFDFGNQAKIESAEAFPLNEGQNDIVFDEGYNEGDVITVWFVSHKDDDPTKMTCTGKPCVEGNAKFLLGWQKESGSSIIPAVEMILYYDRTGRAVSDNPDFSGVRVKRFTFDPDILRRNNNKFGEDGTTTTNGTYYTVSNIRFGVSGRPLFARIRILYGSVSSLTFSLGEDPTATLPSQGRLLVSKGSAGGATRKIEVRDYYRAPLGIFEAGLVSTSGDLSK